MSEVVGPLSEEASTGLRSCCHGKTEAVGTRSQSASANDQGLSKLHLIVENISCPSCIQPIEASLKALPDVEHARVNFSTRRLAVGWRPGALTPEDIVGRLAERGFRAVPYDPAKLAALSNREVRTLLRALAVAGFAAGNVMLLSVSVWSGLASDMGEATRSLFHWVSALIALPAIAYAGRPFFISAWEALRGRRVNMDVPISLAIILASGMSLYHTFVGGSAVYFDAALMLLFFLLIGRTLDRQSRAKARSAAENLLGLQALSARMVEASGEERLISLEEIRPGMTLAVAAGERVPADGRLLGGQSEIDASLVTGESLPQPVAPGAKVYAGCLNLSGPLRIAVEAVEGDTLLAEIVRLTEMAEQRRGRYRRLADRAASIYVPVVHGLALLTFLGWFALAAVGWEAALMNAVAVLIITCPCALGLAVPAVQVAAAARLFRQGVLVKAADGLERLAEIDHVVFDKTGTLTLGQPALVNRSEIANDDLALAASIAGASKHPLARALVDAAGPLPLREAVQELPGLGLLLDTPEGEIRLGNRRHCGLSNQEAPQAGPELWLVGPKRQAVLFQFEDGLRPDAAATIARLQDAGLSVELLSGDGAAPVATAAADAGILSWRAAQPPQAKIARLEDLRAGGKRALMVGDGLNDAPALASAHASLSPATAADIAQTAADFVFQGKSLAAVGDAWAVARLSRRLALQNLAIAFGYNVVAVPLAVSGLVTPLIAAVAMSASSIVVTLNALRLHRASMRGAP